MTLLFNTGFDWVDTTSDATIKAALALDAWFVINQGNTVQMSGGAGLYGGKYVGFAKAGFSGYAGRGLGGDFATGTFGFHFRTGALPTDVAQTDIFALVDGSTKQIELRLHTNGALSIGRNGTLLGSATAGGVIAANTWYFVEIKATIHPSAGSVEVRLNGAAPVLNLSGQNTRASANSSFNTVALCRSQNNANDSSLGPLAFDDLYFCDTAGTLNSFLGPCRSELQTPAADVLAGFTRSAGASNASTVDDVPLSATADYNAATAAAEDRFTVTALGSTPASVKAVSLVCFDLKTDAGGCTARNRLTSGGTTGSGATKSSPASLAARRDVFETNPATGVAFTPSAVNAMHIGYERVS